MRSVATDEGRTVLYVTHNLVNLEHLCPRSLLLVNGRLAFDGATHDTLTQYLHMLPRGEASEIRGVFDLSAGDRGGDYPMQLFKRLELRPGGGRPSDSVRMGERLQIEIDVEGLDEVPDANVHVTVGSGTTAVIFRMSCRMTPFRAAQERRSQERILIDIPSLLLTPGDYHIHVGAHDARTFTLLDEVRAAEFTVISGDVLGTGYEFTFKDGAVHVPWDWEVRPAVAGVTTA
jgi:lipopolysaccharide transport system ATP-binding protein